MENLKGIKTRIISITLLCLLSFIAAFVFTYFSAPGKIRNSEIEKKIEETLREKEAVVQNLLLRILSGNFAEKPVHNFRSEFPRNDLEEDGLSVFLYRNDSLVFWSTNKVPVTGFYRDEDFSSTFRYYGNGWFRILTEKQDNLKAVGLILVKNDFPYQNEYLINDFQEDFNISEMRLSLDPGIINIQTGNGEFLFSLDPETKEVIASHSGLVVFALFIVSFLSLIVLVFLIYNRFDFLRKRPVIMFLAFGFDAVLLRFIFLYFQIPGFLYKTELFSPHHYATSFISPSLGDLVINSMLWLTLAWIFFTNFNASLEKAGRILKQGIAFSLILLSGLLYFLLISTLKRLVIDSNIELNLNNIFNADIYSVLGFLAMTSLLFAFFLVTAKLNQTAHQCGTHKNTYFILVILTSLLLIPFFSAGQDGAPGFIYPAMFFVYELSFIYFFTLRKSYQTITGTLVYIVLFSLISTFVLDYYHNTKEKETRKILAAELSTKRDPLMEYEFAWISGQVSADSTLAGILKENGREGSGSDDRAHSYLMEKYFNGLRNKYEILITICHKDEILSIQPGGYLMNCHEYFMAQLKAPGTEALSEDLYFLDNQIENAKYIASINPGLINADSSLKIFIELYYKYIPQEGLGYPDLLIDKKIRTIEGINVYSYARYRDNNLIYKTGDFLYNLEFQAYDEPGKDQYFIDNEGYSHYIVRSGNNNALIISQKNLTWLDLIAPFSYLFIFFSLFILVFFSGYWLSGGFQNLDFSFSNRLQVSILAILIITILILGMITRSNIIHLYNNKNQDNLSEKTFSVLTELEHKIGASEAITSDMFDYVSELLNKFSSVFYSDINLFDTQGTLIASSRPQIYDEELISRQMNPKAFYSLSEENKLLFIQNEQIGRQEYLSAYIPFRNNNDRIIAYLNLPYFAKQTELRKEIGDFLAAYINVYVLLIVLATMLTILVSRFITRPLLLIREKLGNIGLGRPNEKIEWSRKDEIGSLIEEYNRMIDELAKSAEMLARSERESAWREMAMQVAHEIKNPLTPMKLSVQYLQKTWDERKPDWEHQLKRFTHTIIEQIESLSEIASEFSDFAKMPAATIEKTDLAEIVKSAADLYRHHHNIRIAISGETGPCLVMADKKQLLRAFNNLVQNAVQAIGKKENGQIDILITADGNHYRVAIEDNGTGITDEQAARIFSPSFTTKSSGMGLGLVMVRSILATLGGSVSFESKPGEGATFYVMLPIHHD